MQTFDLSFFHHYQGSIDFNTVNIHRTVGMYFLVSTGNRGDIVSVHCREEGCIGKYAPEAKEISQGRGFCTRGPRAISRAMSFDITPVASGYKEIHPCSAMNIDSVKINTSLIMMKECMVHF